jgi:hypothetical protein
MEFLIVGIGFMLFTLVVFVWAHTKTGKRVLE